MFLSLHFSKLTATYMVPVYICTYTQLCICVRMYVYVKTLLTLVLMHLYSMNESFQMNLFILLNVVPLSYKGFLWLECTIIYKTSPSFRDHSFFLLHPNKIIYPVTEARNESYLTLTSSTSNRLSAVHSTSAII